MSATPSPALPTGYACGLALTVELDVEPGAADAAGRDLSARSFSAFGPDVGLDRVLSLLAAEELTATFFVAGTFLRDHRAGVERVVEAGHDVALHGYDHRSPLHQTPAEERADFERALTAFADADLRPAGYRAPGTHARWTSLELVAAHRLAYDSSLMDDDRPYVLSVGESRVVEIPPHWSLDDSLYFDHLPDGGAIRSVARARHLADAVAAEVAAQRRYGGVGVITLHPYLSGRVSRIAALREMLAEVRTAGDVWIGSMSDLATRTLAADSAPRALNRPDVTPYEHS